MKFWVVESWKDAPMEPIGAFRDRELALAFAALVEDAYVSEVELATPEELEAEIAFVEQAAKEDAQREIDDLTENLEDAQRKIDDLTENLEAADRQHDQEVRRLVEELEKARAELNSAAWEAEDAARAKRFE